ncbi:MAG: helix-hairpin-helix domain-containing protein [Planctomycetes bacterium]|nr:helix-hairpin-helix domain-containing protein [Planctomycetota bacterium]
MREAGGRRGKAGGWAARADGVLAAGLLAASVAWCAGQALDRRAAIAAAPPPPDPYAVAHRVDLSRAGEAELRLLPGVGPALAARIAGERERGGGFASLEDVARRVPGVGPARVRWWRDRAHAGTDAAGGPR